MNDHIEYGKTEISGEDIIKRLFKFVFGVIKFAVKALFWIVGLPFILSVKVFRCEWLGIIPKLLISYVIFGVYPEILLAAGHLIP